MAGNFQALDQKFALVNADGTPTDYFIRWSQQRQIDIGDSITSEEAQALVDARTGLTVLYVLNSGAIGVNVGPELPAPRSGSLTICRVVTKTSDPAVDLAFTIKKNGVAVFSSNPIVPHGTGAGVVTAFTNLSPNPLAVAAQDIFTIDVSTGSSAWQVTVVLE